MDENGHIASCVALLQAPEDGLHVRVVVRVDLGLCMRSDTLGDIILTHDGKDDVSLGRESLEELKVLDSSNGSLQAKSL